MQHLPANGPSPRDIETIVQTVLQRLRSMDAAQTAMVANVSTLGTAEATPPSDTLRLDQRLVTLNDLAGRLGAFKVLQVDARAVVTPAVQDELRDRGVSLQRVPRQPATAAKDEPQLLIIASPNKQSAVASQVQALQLQSLAAADDDNATVELLSHQLRAGVQAGIWCAAKPFAAMRATLHQPSIVAVQLSKLNDLAMAVEEANPNTLILSDRDWSVAAVAGLARAWKKILVGRMAR
jgi:hypothetical protein